MEFRAAWRRELRHAGRACARLARWIEGRNVRGRARGLGARLDGAHRRRAASARGRSADRPGEGARLREWGLSLDEMKAPRLAPVSAGAAMPRLRRPPEPEVKAGTILLLASA